MDENVNGDLPLTYTLQQTADLLNVSKGTVWKTCKTGNIPAIQVQSTWRILGKPLRAILEGNVPPKDAA